MRKFIKPSEAAKILAVSLPKIYKLCNSPGFPAIQIGDDTNYKKKTWRIDSTEFKKWLTKKEANGNV